MSSICISHPSTAPFVLQAARAFHEQNALAYFFTTIAFQPDRYSHLLLKKLANCVGKGKQLERRSVYPIPTNLVKSRMRGELLRLATARFDKSGIATDKVWERAEHAFDQWVARMLPENCSAVYGYEHACLASFKKAAEIGATKIYDVPAPEHSFVENLLKSERAKFPSLQTKYYEHTETHEQQRTQRRRQEWELADCVIANSTFTKNSYAAAGLDTHKVHVVPYGAPSLHEDAEKDQTYDQGPLKLLWAGSFSVRKGAHYLLDVWDDYLATNAKLSIFGAADVPGFTMQNPPPGISYSPTIPHSQLTQEYLDADLLVFPTLCDGFGMVVTEALAHGLPVLTTERAGAADLIVDGQNGFLISAMDPKALYQSLHSCIEQTSKIRSMRRAALESVKNWQWTDYREKLCKIVLSCSSEAHR